MAWKIELTETAQRQLEKLDKAIANRIGKFLRARLASLENPRAIGEALKGERFGELWKYRVGHYRLIAKIEDQRLVILVVTIGQSAGSVSVKSVFSTQQSVFSRAAQLRPIANRQSPIASRIFAVAFGRLAGSRQPKANSGFSQLETRNSTRRLSSLSPVTCDLSPAIPFPVPCHLFPVTCCVALAGSRQPKANSGFSQLET